MTAQMCRHRESGPSIPSKSMKPLIEMDQHFESIVIRIADITGATVDPNGIVYVFGFPIGMRWFMNPEFVEIHGANVVKATEPIGVDEK